MVAVSVVIITKNEAKNIVDCIRSARTITKNIIVVDAESEDDTAALAANENAIVINLKWNGYGYARNIGAASAEHDWILSLDADERITPSFVDQLQQHFADDPRTIYAFKRRNFFNEKEIKYGELGADKVCRLYNRAVAKWDASPVHEKLTGNFHTKKRLNLSINHYPIQSYSHYRNKRTQYAYLCAVKYIEEGKSATCIKRVFAASFNFFKSYFFLLGFLDGERGLTVAKVHAYYTWLKYHYLHQLSSEHQSVATTNRLTDFQVTINSFLK